MSQEKDAAEIHRSVLLSETISFLAPKSGGVYVDGTLGLGGHTEALLKESAPEGRVIGFDWDEAALARSGKRLQCYGERLVTVRRNFAEIGDGLAELGIEQIDGLVIDVGLSSLQLDIGGRGFSFQRDEPLDMRMDTRRNITAAKLLATCSESELADIFFYYGEEKQARRIASFLVRERAIHPLSTSKQLADLVARAVPRRFHPKNIHVATLVFQALRIAVNTELENLAAILTQADRFLAPGARFCVISFHSLEDRMVKRKFRENQNLKVLTKKPIFPSPEEVAENPRARSGRLRVAEKQ